MVEAFPIAFLFFAGAALLALLPKGALRAGVLLAVPLVALYLIWNLPEGNLFSAQLLNVELELMRVDRLSRIFAIIFCVAAFLANLYALHVKDTVQQVAALAYSGSAIGAVFAGDLIALFLFWEGTAITSVFLIWARRTEGALATGMRYLIIQVSSGVMLLAGTVLIWQESGSFTFEAMTLGSLGTWLLLASFGIKAAFPLMGNWLSDAYPAATVTGTVILSAFTTKLAIYALARGFPGTELLIYVGAVMTLLPTLYAILENDLRRVLAYSLNIQLGFMVVGVGIGTELSLNGTVAHAFAGILYKALLFMGVGAVLYRTGTAKASELGGLHRTMPLTLIFCAIGAMSIAAFPWLSGFISKSLILSAAAYKGYYIIWGVLLFASAVTLHHSGLKILHNVFFGRDSGLRPKEAPVQMLLAMGMTAALCIALGIFPTMLYDLLPFAVDYAPYTLTHIVTQFQLLLFALLSYVLLVRSGLYPAMTRSVYLDTDWSYRRMAPAVIGYAALMIGRMWTGVTRFGLRQLTDVATGLYKTHGPEGRIARVWPTGSMVLWVAVLLAAALLVNFL